ncbi:helix-turn-helix transcriptional regulator [Tropicibacter oceani]|uniref:Helix-turn-helix transcriptional regulator n=1 Tax=Tropicibacter oceani TaxID=3058420 RepID=A0ABY8QIN9_9RHOB|nr:helix-turn-helix transcriptional regulator [Tropicibacter oceani]WGW04485.1 helix-turn-helix transcriptional regulator [Tropicibacter oceani]
MADDHRLIQAIYDTALRQDALPDVLQDLCTRVGAFGAMIFDCTTQDGRRQVGLQHLSSAYDPDFVQAYVEAYNDQEVADQDRLADLSSTGNEINLIHDKALYRGGTQPGPNVAAMLRRGVSDRYGALLSKESWNTDRFAFQFWKNTPLPSSDQIVWAEAMLSHLAKALSMGRAVRRARVLETALDSFLDSLRMGIAVIGPSGQVIFANTEMLRIVQDRQELSINRAGNLICADGAQQPKLHALLSRDDVHGRHGARPRNEAVLFPDPDSPGEAALFVEVCPLDNHPELDKFGAGTRLVTVLDGSASQQIDAQAVARYFPLSKAEIALLGLLGDGLSNAEIAAHRARSVETINSQIKSVLRKTGTRNRTELVKVAMGLTATAPSRPLK